MDGYRELAPPPALRESLACLWVQTVPAGAAPTRILPDACVDLIWQRGRGGFVAGPDTAARIARMAPGTVIVGARFLPGAGGPALGHPLDDLRDVTVEAAALHPALERWLDPELEPGVALRRVTAVAARLALGGPPDASVRAAARRLADPRARLHTLADDVGLSERQLRRRCHASVGYGPKTLQRVLRFRRFLARLDAEGPRLDLARAAFDAGYADQAHLTRECGRLAGLAPAALARARRGV